MDHFIGFDHLLRVCLGRDKHLTLFGPPGFMRNVEGKLAAYTWNLVENYTNDFILSVAEVHPSHVMTKEYRCNEAFRPVAPMVKKDFEGVLLDDPLFLVRAAFLHHKVPCLAFVLEEKTRVNIKKNVLEEMGLTAGPWLLDLKRRILRNDSDDTPIRAPTAAGEKVFPLGLLRDRVVKLTTGKKIAYVADVLYSEVDARKIEDLARGAEILFIEAGFLEADADRAAEKHHLTALQSGKLAKRAGVKRMVLFHFSPKYQGQERLLVEEAQRAFEDSYGF
jgi:ribonuclease Z